MSERHVLTGRMRTAHSRRPGPLLRDIMARALETQRAAFEPEPESFESVEQVADFLLAAIRADPRLLPAMDEAANLGSDSWIAAMERGDQPDTWAGVADALFGDPKP